ncbi:hypothetical protein [Konateibacter massiliensis]|uniref:hypothetical protein n=1 Tax=Konateibacter massiliensis TaxID=2002841 RepID=UPI000C156C84|nr:hypothetical protein [Konateibacter massiliensis]
MQKIEDIKVPESLQINIFSNELAELINNTPLSLSIKTYILRDLLGQLVEANNLQAQKEIEEYNTKITQLEEQNNTNNQEAE